MRKVVLFSILLVSLVSLTASAQSLTYNAKYVCGKTDDESVKLFAFAPGAYFTSVNVHTDKDIEIRKRFSISLLDEKSGPISDWVSTFIPGGRSMQIDCGNIYGHLGVPIGTFIEGYVTIVSGVKLDVVGVYSVDGGAGVASIHTERVPPS
jgi:hypothetical protein